MGKILSTYLCPHPPIILHEIGKGKEKEVEKTIEALLKVASEVREKEPNTILIITPHGPLFRDALAVGYNEVLYGDMSKFGCKEVTFSKKNNLNLVNRIAEKALKEEIYCVKLNERNAVGYEVTTELDHGVQVPLYFIDKKCKDYQVVHITYGLLPSESLYKFGMLVQQSIESLDGNVVVIASGDLSHRLREDGPYGFDPSGPEFDNYLIKLLEEGKYEEILAMDKSLAEEAGECGLKSLQIMLGVLDGYEVESEVLSYEGPFGVGYGVAKFQPCKKSKNRELLHKLYKNVEIKMKEIRSREDTYVKLARLSLETYIKYGNKISIPLDTPEELLTSRAGVFVSIKKDGALRGCIGTIGPTTESIAQEIVRNAIQAGTEDPRFFPIQEKELNQLVYSVDVLGEPEEVNSYGELDEKKYGVIVTKNGKRGLLLPNLEGVNSVEEQVNIALEKANISLGENFKLERFEVIRHR